MARQINNNNALTRINKKLTLRPIEWSAKERKIFGISKEEGREKHFTFLSLTLRSIDTAFYGNGFKTTGIFQGFQVETQKERTNICRIAILRK